MLRRIIARSLRARATSVTTLLFEVDRLTELLGMGVRGRSWRTQAVSLGKTWTSLQKGIQELLTEISREDAGEQTRARAMRLLDESRRLLD